MFDCLDFCGILNGEEGDVRKRREEEGADVVEVIELAMSGELWKKLWWSYL